MNVTDILEDSPNGYRVTADAPKVVDEAIRYYLVILEKYPVEEYPVEFGMVNYGMGKLLFSDTTKAKISEERAKRIENALFHLNQALHVFNSSDYPTMYGLISIMMAKLFRERATLISNRSFLAERSSPEDSVLYGIDQILEAFPIFFRSKAYIVEHALCSLEAGWLYLLQSEFLDNFRDDSIREQAATYLERAISLVQTIVQKGDQQVYTYPGAKEKRWNPVTTPHIAFPEHVQMLMEHQPFQYIEGSALYLLGRLYQGWTELNAPGGGIAAADFELQNQIKSFDYYSKTVRPKYLPKECFLWADAHHRIAVTLIKYPKVINPDYVDHDVNVSDIHLEVAITHLNLALRCPALTGPASMDLHFHLAQTAISRLQMIIDRIPLGQSVTKALRAHSEGMDLITAVEEHLTEARKRVTPASTQTTQDGYLYFFSCMKISEYRMLEAACKPELKPVEREDYLTDAIEHLIDALNARTLTDNTDLHYVATVQMSQLLLAVKRSFAASKSYAKTLFTLCVIINRSLFNPEDVQAKLSEETVRQVGQSLAAGARDVPWVKLHFGPISLNERLAAGYASWSFEDCPSVKISENSSAYLDTSDVDTSVYKQHRASISNGTGSGGIAAGPPPADGHADDRSASTAVPIYKATPPKGVPPLKLPLLDNKKVYITGEAMPTHLLDSPGGAQAGGPPADTDGSPGGLSVAKKKPPPPSGAVPLFALGHNPQYNHSRGGAASAPARQGSITGSGGDGNNYYLGPYGRRMRRQIPPTKEMFDIDQNNMKTFGFRNGKAAFLLPSHIKKRSTMAAKQKKIEVLNLTHLAANKFGRPGTAGGSVGAGGGVGANASSTGSNNNHGKSAVGTAAGEDEEQENEENDDESDQDEGDDDQQQDDDDEGDEGGDQFATRGRSKSIRPARGGPPPPMEDPGTSALTRPVPLKKGVFSWLFGRKRDKTAKYLAASHTSGDEPTNNKTKKGGFSLFGVFGARKEAEAEVDDSLEMWASAQCFYTYNVLSRQSRMQLVLRCSRLEALDGERTNYMLFKTKPKYLNTYYGLKKLLTKDCAKLVVPPVSMKDLASRPFLEVQALFTSQVKICRKLDDLEHLLYNKISKYDNFLPFITCAPVFTRDLNELDSSLLNAERLIMNLANEDALLHHLERKKARLNAGGGVDEKAEKIPDQAAKGGQGGKSQFSYDSVSSAQPSTATALSTVTQVTQNQQAAEEVAVGKMTLSLSQCLDGSNYLLHAQQGSRDMLETYLAQDECMMVWHLPVVPSQNIQVVLIWRDHSATVAGGYNASLSREALSKKNKQTVASNMNMRAKGSNKASKNKGGAAGAGAAGEEGHRKGIVMEIAKSDLDTSHLLQYIQGYLDALHSRSAPLVATMSTDALRALSCALSMTEFLHMIPPHVKSLVVCCPSQLRIIPWHLLLIEQASNAPFSGDSASPQASKPTEIHLMERFNVRLGPTLSLFEMNECGGRALRHSVGLHRMCVVDGQADGPERHGGIRGTDLEVACVSNVWSADPDDYRVLSNDAAVPRVIQTGLFGDGVQEDFKQFKQDIYVKRREKIDHTKVAGGDEDFVSRLKAKHEARKSQKGSAGDSRKHGAGEQEGEGENKEGAADGEGSEEAISSSEEEDDEDDEGEEGGAGRNKRKKGKLTASGQDMKALTMCRVLHVSALKVPLPNSSPVSKNSNSSGGDGSGGGNKGAAEKESLFAQIALPRYDQLVTFRDPRYKKKLLKRNRDERLDDARQVLSSKEVIQQVFVQNCALCVMSRYGLVDDLTDIRTPASWGLCDSNTEFVEALHLSGAKTVLHPIWGGDATGLGALAHIVFLIRFYSVLPSNSKSRLSIVETVRQTQLWLRDASADSIIAFIHKAPIPKPARKCIIDELESFVSSSLTPAQQQMKLEAMKRTEEAASRAAPSKFISPNKLASPAVSIAEGAPSIVVTTEDGETLGNRIGGTVKFFSHFLHWGSFTVSGTGASVHHPDLTLNKDEGLEGHISWDDKELNNMSYEASMLRAEGKIGEAKELEKLIRKLRMDRIKRNIAAAKGAGARAGRGILDTLDFLDKKLLDQDSDEISVSDDSEEERRRRKLKKQNKARESDSDEYSVDDDDLGALKKTGAAPSSGGVSAEGSLATATSPAPLAKTPSKKFVPRALELGSMKPEDIAYEKWKSKVGGLNMNVRDPVLAPRRTKAASAGQDSASYEYNMMQKVAEGGEQVETQQDYDARMEQLYAKKDRAKARRLKKAAEDSSGEEGEDSDGSGGDEGDTASAKARRAARRKQRRNAQEDSESEYEASEDEASDEEDGDEDGSDGDEGGLYAQRKKLRKKKAAKKAGKVKKVSRFALALKEVRGGVRSYSSVVKTLTEQVPDRQKAKQLLLDSIAGKKGDEKHLGPDGVAPSEDEDGKCVIA